MAQFKAAINTVKSFELLREGFPAGALSPLRVYVSLPPGSRVLDSDSLERLDTILLELVEHPAVADALGPSRPLGTEGPPVAQLPKGCALRFVSADGNAARIEVVLKTNPYSEEALDVVPELRALASQSAAEVGLPSGNVLVGGDAAESYDTRSAGNRDSLVVLPLILLAIGVVLALLLRSLVAPLYLMATIAFTYFATLGLATVVFVVLVGHPGLGPAVPFFLFVFLNALSVDYNIYLISDVPRTRRGGNDSAGGGDPLRPGPYRPGHHLGGNHSRRHFFGADDASAPGPVAAGFFRCRGSANRHVHHPHPDRAVGGLSDGQVELVALPAHVIDGSAEGTVLVVNGRHPCLEQG